MHIGRVYQPPGRPSLVLRVAPRKFFARFAAPLLVTYLVFGCGLLGGVLLMMAVSLRLPAPAALLIIGLPVAAFGVLFGGIMLAGRHKLIGAGPLLVADRSGVWVRPLEQGRRPVWLPWGTAAAVYVTRWGLEKAVGIDPDSRAGIVPPGTQFRVARGMTDYTAEQIVAAMVHLSGGQLVARSWSPPWHGGRLSG